MTKDLITLLDGTNTWPPASAGVTNRLMPKAALWNTCAPVVASNAYRPPPFVAAHTSPPATMGGPNVMPAPARQSGATQGLSHGPNDGAVVLTCRATMPRPSHS